MTATTIDVSNELQLNQAIASADAATSGSFDIVFAVPTITEGTDTGGNISFGVQTLAAPPDLYAVNLHSGVSLTINGAGGTLDGAHAYRGFFVYDGNVTIQNLTIADAAAIGGAGAEQFRGRRRRGCRAGRGFVRDGHRQRGWLRAVARQWRHRYVG